MIPNAKKLLMSISSPPFADFCMKDDHPGRTLLSLLWASSMVLGCKYIQIF